jgi:hypothetical protein
MGLGFEKGNFGGVESILKGGIAREERETLQGLFPSFLHILLHKKTF